MVSTAKTKKVNFLEKLKISLKELVWVETNENDRVPTFGKHERWPLFGKYWLPKKARLK